MKFFTHPQPKIGIALGSGAARGLAHIGVLRALKEASIPIDLVTGTSMGALVGACFARDGDISAVEETAMKTGRREIARLLDPGLLSLRKGLIRGQRVEQLLHSLIGNARFEDMKIPFAAVTTDVNTGQEIVIQSGSVVEAVRASISIPGIFVPPTLDGKCLVDGGLTNPVPVSIARDMGANFIIAMNVLIDPQKSKRTASSRGKGDAAKTPNIFNTLIQSIYIMEYELLKPRILNADVVINPDVSHIEAYEFHRSEEAIAEGYIAARKALPEIRTLLGKRFKHAFKIKKMAAS